MHKKIISILAIVCIITAINAAERSSGPIGFGNATTGGAGGKVVSAATGNDIQAALTKGVSGVIINVTGEITPSNSPSTGKIEIKEVSNISIIGQGDKGVFNGIGIKVFKSSNVIIQNLRIHHVLKNTGEGDCINIEGPNVANIWVDHCEFYSEGTDGSKETYDALLDAKKESEKITVSYCYFHDHYKTSLIGYTDDDTYDRKITYHHNLFYNCNSRLPSIRGGTGHCFNNVYINSPTSGINCRMGAIVKVEGNYFENINEPITFLDSPQTGYWVIGSPNKFVNCKGSQPTTSLDGKTLSIPYTYTLDDVEKIKDIVIKNVGAEGTKVNITTHISDKKSTISSTQNNPISISDDAVCISLNTPSVLHISVFTTGGREISSFNRSFSGGYHLFKLSTLNDVKGNALPSGAYILQATVAGYSSTKSVVIR